MCRITPDEKTAEYCQITLTDKDRDLVGDADAQYCQVINYKAEDFIPVLACPSNVDNVKPVEELAGKKSIRYLLVLVQTDVWRT